MTQRHVAARMSIPQGLPCCSVAALVRTSTMSRSSTLPLRMRCRKELLPALMLPSTHKVMRRLGFASAAAAASPSCCASARCRTMFWQCCLLMPTSVCKRKPSVYISCFEALSGQLIMEVIV